MRAAKKLFRKKLREERPFSKVKSLGERERKKISRIANPYLQIVKKHFECAFFQFFYRDMYSATITSFKQKEALMQCNLKNFPPSFWLVCNTFAILDFPSRFCLAESV